MQYHSFMQTMQLNNYAKSYFESTSLYKHQDGSPTTTHRACWRAFNNFIDTLILIKTITSIDIDKKKYLCGDDCIL